jgi:metallo-beta-lactamase family protein
LRLTFTGAAGEVTGSCHLVEASDSRFLLDCGMFQGGRDARERNFAPFPFEPRSIDFVLLSHAHLDHCGLLPRLAKLGFRGRIHCTEATADLIGIMLKDSAFIHEKDAAWQARREGGKPEPLYTMADVDRVMTMVDGHPYERDLQPGPGVRVRFRDAGHILGSAIVESWIDEDGSGTKLVFSGDLGQPARPVVRDPVAVEHADVLLVESTYGNRNHKSMAATVDELVEAVTQTIDRGGNLIVPAFALGRTQDLLVMLAEQTLAGRLSDLKVFVDSPLATAATEATLRNAGVLDDTSKDVLRRILAGSLPMQVRFTESVDDSKSLNLIRSGAVIIAASGMCEAGRVRHHLERNVARAECGILFTGFQAEGTLGRRIVDGARSVRLFGDELPVRAKVYTLGGLSAHADRDALLGWLRHFRRPPRQTYTVHGEAETAAGFAETITRELGWRAQAAVRGMTIELQERVNSCAPRVRG